MELSLDLGLVYVSKTVAECLKEVAKVKDVGRKLSKLSDYVNRLEEERRKIEVFSRELPLCMLLLNDAILKLKEEALRYKELNDRAVVAEGEGGEGKMMNKKSWMDSVQLWRTGDSKELESKSEPKQQRSEEEDDRSTCENPIQQLPSREGAFMALKQIVGCGRKEEKEVVSEATELSLMTPSPPESVLAPNRGGNQPSKVQSCKPQASPSQQLQAANKKLRRCWAPELHRQFMNVLDELGGPNVATPKQIRERMQVEGLTNDEVKSHLQKYRLHIRKHITAASSSGPANGLWTPKYESNSSNKAPKPKALQSCMEDDSMGGFSRSSSHEGENLGGGGGGDEKSESHDSSERGNEKVGFERREVDVWR